jgi:hypothetical protein
MKTTIDDAIRIARRWATQGTSPSPAQISGVFLDLARMDDPDEDQPPVEDWGFESDGDGQPRHRKDQYIVGSDGLERIADFHGPDAHKNARAASCVPRMIAALRGAEGALKISLDKGAGEEIDEALVAVSAALKAARYRKSG